MEEFVSNHLGEIIIGLISYLINRSIKNTDKAIEKLVETVESIEGTCATLTLEVSQRPNWTATKRMSNEVTKAQLNQHIIDDHKTT